MEREKRRANQLTLQLPIVQQYRTGQGRASSTNSGEALRPTDHVMIGTGV